MANDSAFSERLDTTRQDIRFAIRSLLKNRGFTSVAVLTLALGIGANSAIFSVVNGVLLKPLDFPHPEQLLRVWQDKSNTTPHEHQSISAVNLDDWRARRQSLADIGGYWFSDGQSGTDLTGAGEPRRLQAAFITPGFWATLGVPPVLGRLPRDEEMVRGSNDRLVVMSYDFWQRQFGASRSVIGQRLMLGGESYEIVGVMPESFRFPSPLAEIFIPFSTIPDHAIPRLRGVQILSAVARMKPGVTLNQANAELNSIARGLAEQYPEENGTRAAASAVPLQDAMVGNVRTSLLVLLGAVAFVLLIAAVNLASLSLARATARERELAIRAALGAERGRIVRQLFTESLILSLVGGALGVGVAQLGARLLLQLGSGQLPRAQDVDLDSRVLLFTLVVSIVTGVIFGLVPAIRAASPELQQMLREGTRGSTRGVGPLRNALVVTEIALAMILVVGAGLMTRSFVKLLNVDLGFTPEKRVALNYTISSARHPTGPEMRQTSHAILEKVRTVPGVLAAGTVRDLPFRGDGESVPFSTPGMASSSRADSPHATMMFTSDGFFSAMGIPMLAGRDLSPADRDSAPLVVVVNQALAKKYFANRSPVGQWLAFDTTKVSIVGVVGDVRQKAVDETPEPRLYMSLLQVFRVKTNLVVRTNEDPAIMIKRIEEAIHSVEPQQTITSAFTLDQAVGEAVARPRLLTVLLGLFGAMGLVLGALGIYGVLAYLVAQRTREIGVRLALGAQRRDVLAMVVGNGLRLATAGVAIGLLGAFLLTRLMQGVLYGVTASDPLTFGAVAVALLVVAAFASWLPALRATRVDPLVALRAE